MTNEIQIRPFTPELQNDTRGVVLAGLADHWGDVDDSLNQDLCEIAATYVNDVFLVALTEAGDVVGAGALRVRPPEGEIVRMSVRRDYRRRGIATRVTYALLQAARNAGITRVVLETQATWTDVRKFYEAVGFKLTHYAEGDFGTDAWYALTSD